jgi:putative transposase
MVSDLFFSQLMLIALLWLCVMLHGVWPSDPTMASPTLLPATLPPPKRSREPKPFAGLTRQPHCDACEHASDSRPHASSAPPPRIVMTRGRRREVDPSRHFYPNPDCASRGWVAWGNLRANGHPNGGPWRQLLCVACHRSFLETLGTIFHGKRASVELIVRVIACLAEGLGIRGTARVFEVDPNTVLQWLVEAAEQLHAFSRHVLHDVRVRQVQLDELFALLSAVKDGKVSAAEGFVANLHLRRFVLWSFPVIYGAQRGRTTMAISFKGAHFPQDIILMGVRWYVAYPLSSRHVEELLEERGVPVDHATIQRWVVKYSPLLEAAFQRRKRAVWLSWRMDETYIKVKGQWYYLYRAVDKTGQTIDFLLTEHRDEAAALRFLKKAIRRHGVPEKITIDGSAANEAAIKSYNEEHGTAIIIRQVKYLNNIVEQDHRGVKRVTRPMLGFKAFAAAQDTLVGIELMHMIKKRQMTVEAGAEGLTAAELFYSMAA